MVNLASAAGFSAMSLGITAVPFFSALDKSAGTGTTGFMTSAPAPPVIDSSIKVLLPLAATVALITAVACIYRRLPRAAAGGNGRLSELVTFTLSTSAGILLFCFSVQPGDGVDDAAKARALGTAAAGALPAAAAVTFFLGVALVLAAHVRVGGEGGGTVAGAGYGSVQAAVWLLTKMALGAAAALIGLMAVVLYTNK